MQNAVPDGSPMKRRCASCKHVWELLPYVVLEGPVGNRFYTTHKGEEQHTYRYNHDESQLGVYKEKKTGVYILIAYVDTPEEAMRVINGVSR
jgi:hypothetical protein